MVLIGPVSMSVPDWLSKEYLMGGVGVAGGLIFSDYMAASLISRTGWSAEAALAGSAAAKVGLGGILLFAATKVTDRVARPILGLASVGCFASVIIDGIRYVWPQVGTPSARLQAATRGFRPVAAAAPTRMAPQIAVRAETPSGIALGGF